jgi:hypothetical protein
MPKLNLPKEYKIYDIKLATNKDPIKSIIWNGKLDIDVSDQFRDCQIQSGLHFLLWGYYGSPDGQGQDANKTKEIIKIYSSNCQFLIKNPSLNTEDGYTMFFNESFGIYELPNLRWNTDNINTNVSGSGIQLIASFFETTDPIITIKNNYDEGIDNEGNILIDHIFYTDYEIFDFERNKKSSNLHGHKLYKKYDINVIENIWKSSYNLVIPKNNNFSKCDIFINLFDNASKDGESETNYIAINNNKEILPFSFYDETLNIFYKLNLDCSKDIKLTFNAGPNYYAIEKLRVIYHN